MKFKKGHLTWNKGTKGICKANATSFKPGQKPNKTSFKPSKIGTITTRKDGYSYIKTEFGWKYFPKEPPTISWRKILEPSKPRVFSTAKEWNIFKNTFI